MKIRLSSAVPGAVLATLPVLLAAQNLAAQTSEELLERIDLQDEVIAEASAEVDEAENNFAQAEADLAQCRIENARCEELVSRRAAAQEAVAQAVADLEAAQRNFQRVEALFQQGVVSRVEFEAAENDLAVAENNLGTREAELAVIESQLEQCEEEEASTPNPACEDAAAQVAIREEERQEAEARRAAALAVRADLVADLENTVVKENRPDPVQTTVLGETPQISFPMREGFVYQSQVSSDLRQWRDVFNPVEGEEGAMFVSEPELAKIDFTYHRVSMRLSERGREMLAAGELP